MPPARHHQGSVRRGVRRSRLHSASAEAAKAPYPLAPSSFPNCDRCAGSQFGVIWGGPCPPALQPEIIKNKNKNYFYFLLDKSTVLCYIDIKIIELCSGGLYHVLCEKNDRGSLLGRRQRPAAGAVRKRLSHPARRELQCLRRSG